MEISEKEYELLLDKSARLDALVRGGVDTWDGIEGALVEYYVAKELRDSKNLAMDFRREKLLECLHIALSDGVAAGREDALKFLLAYEEAIKGD